ncbi:MAG: DUF3307 domain-containing protein [Patescibacteria group bacterium]|nr:DUF3307 domain-containing protein [Patescibacteria group bacterium]
MDDLFIKILFGHLMGDYLLQSKVMALKKSEKTCVGLFWCSFHSLLYAFSICLFIWRLSLPILILVFLSHWPIDRWSWAEKWLKLIRGRNFISAYQNKDKYWEIDLVFSCLVYAVVDNTFHLLILWVALKHLV